jgi:hypothetical protein
LGARFENAVRSKQDDTRPSRSGKQVLLHTEAGDETGIASVTAMDLNDAPRKGENVEAARFSGLGRISIVRGISERNGASHRFLIVRIGRNTGG